MYLSKLSIPVLSVALLVGSAMEATAQLQNLPYQLKYDRGQTVQPVFEGWSRNAEGTFDMHFGYLNRNYVEELNLPVGPDNRMEPGDADRGQPTFFQVRSNRNIFTVTVPSDFGDQELVWSLTSKGETLRAIGWLDPQWEITETGTGALTGDRVGEETNQAPKLTVEGSPFSATLQSGLTVRATARDDGMPEPREQTAGSRAIVGTQAQPPLLTPAEGALEIAVNLPQHVSDRRFPPRGEASVSYQVWRGPANITTDPYFAEAENGTATTRVTFTEPGEYQLLVSAHDGELTTEEFITVNVRE